MSRPLAEDGDESHESVLDRVKRFLPLIEKSNRELAAKIISDGQDSIQIDKGIAEAPTGLRDGGDEAGEDDETCAHDVVVKESEEVEEVSRGDARNASILQSQPLIQLEFALGDFDETPLANLEEESAKES